MKKLITFLTLGLLLIAIQAWGVGYHATGLTATDSRSSFAAGDSWLAWDALDFSAYGTGNWEVILTDSSGNRARGIAGVVGTGEALGGEVITDATNRDFSGAGDWIASGASTVTVNYDSLDIGHDTTMRVEAGDTLGEGADLPAVTAYAVTSSKLYILTFDYKDVESTNNSLLSRVRLFAGVWQENFDLTVSAIWAISNTYFVPTDTDNIRMLLYTNRGIGHADNETLFDSVTLKQITEPAATGIHILDGLGGSAAWAEINSNFDYNDIVEIEILPAATLQGVSISGVTVN